ncbi:thioredoxin domain-containing protein 11 [Trichomycterus rosablanca]|uniref:thioredoxin domain-containing protein 11 n=1 Tax=Trichomycterus rosablanca TaxID=2290929 RepID=UPI002F358447
MRGVELVRVVRDEMARRPGMLCAVLLLTCTVILLLTCSRAKSVVAVARPPVRFFPPSVPVLDLYQGQEDQVQFLTEGADVVLLFYYAPWCAHSMGAREHVQQVAQHLHTQVQFVAVNCWWHQGRCRKQRNFPQYPVIHLYYRRFGPIQYKGPVTVEYLENFIRRICTPLTYLPSVPALHIFLSHHQQGVVGFFEFNSSPQPPGYLTFLSSALHMLSRDSQGTVRFGVVTNRKVAEEISLRRDQTVYLHRRFNSSLVFPRAGQNFTAEALCSWVLKNSERTVTWIQLLGEKSHALEVELQKGPALLVFLPQSPLVPGGPVSEVAEVALRYHSCYLSDAVSASGLSAPRCCKSLSLHANANLSGGVCELCVSPVLAGEHWRCPATKLDSVLDSFLRHPAPAPSSACSHARHHYGSLGHYSACCDRLRPLEEGGVTGLHCRTNKTLRFYLLDSRLSWPLAQRLGATGNDPQTFITIVNLRDDTHYVLQDPHRDTLERFIVNFSAPYSPLQRHLVGEAEPHPPQSQPLIQEVSTHSFTRVVMDPERDVLLFYYTSWCGFCTVLNHVLLKLARLLQGNGGVVVARVNVGVNDLPWEFMVDHLPTFLFFPKHRKHMSVKFPENLRITLPNLVRFIVQHSDSFSQEGSGPKALLEVELRTLQGEVLSLQRARERLSQQLATLWRENRRLSRHNEALQSQNAELQEQSDHLETLYREKSRQLSDAVKRLQELADASEELLNQNSLLKVLLGVLHKRDRNEEQEQSRDEDRGETEPDVS